MVAYHYPPQSGSSGVLRSLKFSKYLLEYGWLSTVLTAHVRAYERTDPQQLNEIPAQVRVIRAFALDTKRHLSWRNSYPRSLAIPDRWVSWALGAVPSGVAAIYHERIDVIFTTYPIATANLIGVFLHHMTKRPWVVDFRDSMTEETYPPDRRTWRTYRWIELQAVRHASALLFTAPSCMKMYLQRYPSLSGDRCFVVYNGYDEEDFAGIQIPGGEPSIQDRPVILLHSGMLYPDERDPKPFFTAVSRLKAQGILRSSDILIRLRATGLDQVYAEMVQNYGIDDIVQVLPPIPYHASLTEAASADGLLIFQARNCDHQIPAKLFEYFRLAKPIFALVSPTGDTATLLSEVGGATLAGLDEEDKIFHALPRFVAALKSRAHPLPEAQKVKSFCRSKQAQDLASILDSVAPRCETRYEKPRTHRC
jgi:glycosyltransferase involved in cell wall biosynthesis